LIAAKNGTRGSDSLHNHHLTFLREIPTRISPSAPTAAVVDRHVDDDDVDSLGLPHQTPHIPPDKNTNDPQIISLQPVTHDYVDCTLDKIQTMMRRWSSHVAIHHDPCATSCTTPRYPFSTPPPAPISVDAEPFDTGSKLAEIAAKAEQLHRRIQSHIAVTAPSPNTTATTDDESTNPPLLDAVHSSPAPISDDAEPFDTGSKLAEIAAKAEQLHQRIQSHIVATAPSPNMTATTDDESTNPPLLDAVHSLDNFLIKHPRQTDSTDAHEHYQPSPERRTTISRHALLTQQTLVLSTMNVILSEIRAKLSRIFAAYSCTATYPIAAHMLLPVSPKAPRNPALTELRRPAKTIQLSQQLIPAKPPFTCFNNNLRPYRFKDHLRPP